MHVHSDVIPSSESSLAGVDTYPDTKLPARRPGVILKIPLHVNRSCHSINSVGEHTKESVAFGVHHQTTSCTHTGCNDFGVSVQRVRIPFAQLVQQPGRTLNISEEKGDSSSRIFH